MRISLSSKRLISTDQEAEDSRAVKMSLTSAEETLIRQNVGAGDLV